MIQAPPNHPALVDEIVQTLLTRFRPRRIYLFGSRARGDAKPLSDYDFLMELDTRPEGVPMSGNILWLEDFGAIEVQVHTRSTGALERRKDDPGCVDWDVVREGQLLFTDGSLPDVRPAPDRGVVREPRRDPPKTLREWVRLADQDLRVARHLSSDLKNW
ncbi:MAG: nucleotidyltransferase domain-containing protein, partial [Gemmatimonadota bacterium]|nr:nucleotidyltransferase domain-containing protein [Gemmatimonadota bacterium]